MTSKIYSVIAGTGSYIPENRVPNTDFLSNQFLDPSGNKIEKDPQEIIDKFEAITTISERRYISDDLVTSDMAFMAAERAIANATIDKEALDYIIVAHNFGDITHENRRSDFVPSLAARVKHKLKVNNPSCVAYDLPFGCPGWLQGVIQADYYLRSGDAKHALVIGAETLSRVCDPYDRDSMIYADGAGAVILNAISSSEPIGILSHQSRSDTLDYAHMLYMGSSYAKDNGVNQALYLKMNGRKLYQYALEKVPQAIKDCLTKTGLSHREIKKLLIHQANGKMDAAILSRFYDLYDDRTIPEDIMPMTVSKLGNSSVATIPTLLDLIITGRLEPHQIEDGDLLVFASVGAGMNINAMVYRTA